MKLCWLKNFSLGLLGVVVLALGVSILTATTAATSFSYTVTDLGTLGDSPSQATGINDTGQVVGFAMTSTSTESFVYHAFLWDKGKMNDLGTPDGYSNSHAAEINNSRQVIGFAHNGNDSSWLAILWDKGEQGPPQNLGSLGGNYNEATGINNRGEVVGVSSLSGDTNSWRAFLWTKGRMRNIDTLNNNIPGTGSYSAATSINNKRQIVGQVNGLPYWWDKGTMKALCTKSFFRFSGAYDINDRGQIVGQCGKMATLWNINNGTQKDLGTLSIPGGLPGDELQSLAYGINNRGQVVGRTYKYEAYGMENSYHAFLWVNDTIKDLNSLISANSGWVLTEAKDINNSGQIVGVGNYHNGSQRAFLLTPTWRTN